MIGGVVQSDQAARLHKVADDGDVMNHRQDLLPKLGPVRMAAV